MHTRILIYRYFLWKPGLRVVFFILQIDEIKLRVGKYSLYDFNIKLVKQWLNLEDFRILIIINNTVRVTRYWYTKKKWVVNIVNRDTWLLQAIQLEWL